jgi:hypothetical protein
MLVGSIIPKYPMNRRLKPAKDGTEHGDFAVFGPKTSRILAEGQQ